MANKTYADSVFRYTNPIRYFKKNDPVHYEVLNIPLKQIQENTNWLKDQFESLTASTLSEFTRADFSELKPYVNGTDNVVRVKPGRFTARVNDAYSITPLQFIEQIAGKNFPEINEWEAKSILDSSIQAVADRFKNYVVSSSVGMNGLFERIFTLPMKDSDTEWDSLLTYFNETKNNPYVWYVNASLSSVGLTQYNKSVESIGFAPLLTAESEFMKRWRGVTRLSVVNVEEELSVEIPEFSDDDFYYINESGSKVLLDANQRIDLVFIYSKPIDQPSAAISVFDSNTPRTINKPVLGIVKGAGIGINLATNSPQTRSGASSQKAVDEDGNRLIIPNISDELASNTGIGSIKGSFPSPDDLINLAPLLLENLASDNPALVGQTGLPVAYVVVDRAPQLNSNNVQVISTSKLIDIRPFFRTAELSFNERSGLAAATPQVSLANPVATEGYVDLAVRKLFLDYTTKLGQIPNSDGTASQPATSTQSGPRIVGTGYVKGGTLFGVESVLADFVRVNFGITNTTQLAQEVKSRYGYPNAIQITEYPDWDISEWCKLGNFTSKGGLPNDYINFHLFGPNFNGEAKLPYAAGYNAAGVTKIKTLGTDRIAGPSPTVEIPVNSDGTRKGQTAVYFVKKTIRIDRSQIQWASDYHVNVQLWNCAPLSCRVRSAGGASQAAAGHASIWVDKRQDEFTIFVSWVAADQYGANGGAFTGAGEPIDTQYRPDLARNEGDRFAGFSVISNDIVNSNYTHKTVDGEIGAGVAIYPTVTFQVIGIPGSYIASSANLQGQNPIITLS